MIHRIEGPGDPAWVGTLALFREVFPPATREPDEQILAEVRGEWRLPFEYFAWLEQGQVLGFLRSCRLPLAGAVYVSHIATQECAQGRGIGSSLLVAATQGTTYVCEVEPGPAMDWWTNRGASTLTPTYTQPALRPETEPVPFHLMVNRRPVDPVSFVESYYLEAWGLGRDHPMVVCAVGGIQ